MGAAERGLDLNQMFTEMSGEAQSCWLCQGEMLVERYPAPTAEDWQSEDMLQLLVTI